MRYILSFLSIFLILIAGGVSCGDTATGVEKKDDTEQHDDNDDSEDGNNSLGYPDNYVQWAAYSEREHWGPYNLHDPSCLDDGEWTYCFSTDVAYGGVERTGIMVRRSKDLVNWEYVGWAFDGIPTDAYSYVTQANNGTEPGGIWAPYISKHKDTYRLYYSVSVFGSDASYIGLATSSSIRGPWQQQGAVLTSTLDDDVNAIDPSIVTDRETGQQWMAYGSYFGGLHITQLDPADGKPVEKNDHGKRVAFNVSGALEGSEIIYHEPTDKYYLFVAYGPLYNRYNTRVGRSDNAAGPFVDYFGNDMAENADNYPIITAPYRFDGHSGWQGVSHVGVFREGDQYLMMHQGRLGANPDLMVMHLRKLTWTDNGWPVASPQRHAGVEQTDISRDDITGRWERMSLQAFSNAEAKNQSQIVVYNRNGEIEGQNATWKLEDDTMMITRDSEKRKLYVSNGYDWENQNKTFIYTGLNSEGHAIWGKKIEEL